MLFALVFCGMALPASGQSEQGSNSEAPGPGETAPIYVDASHQTQVPLTLEEAELAGYEVLNAIFLEQETSATHLSTMRVTVDGQGFSHTRVSQTFEGVPVWQGEAIVHLYPDGAQYHVTDDLKRHIDLNTEPEVTGEEAIDVATYLDAPEQPYLIEPAVDLLILARGSAPVLTWRVTLVAEDDPVRPRNPIYFIDAHTGEVVHSYGNLQTGATDSTGNGYDYHDVAIKIWESGSYNYLEDVATCSTSSKRIAIGDLQESYTFALVFRNSRSDNTFGYYDVNEEAGVDAAYAAHWSYKYYLDKFSRNGIDSSYGPQQVNTASDGCSTKAIGIGVHWMEEHPNAAWSSATQVIRLGDAYPNDEDDPIGPFTTLDLVGHEWTHGVMQYEAGLSYVDETGALNESWGDVFGQMVALYALGSTDWRPGNNYHPDQATEAMRDMADPHNGYHYGYTTDDQPDHYSERYIRNYDCDPETDAGCCDPEDAESCDYGGVHINSGIPNHAFYLAAIGGTHHLGGSVTGIGANNAAQAWYTAMTTYMTSGTSFSGAREATLAAAGQLWGSSSSQYTAIAQAWSVCGITTVPGEIYTVAGTGSYGSSGDSGQATSATLYFPSAVSVDPSQNLYIADSSNNKIRKVTPSGIISTFAGTGTAGYTGDSSAATSAQLDHPRGIAVDATGIVYISDTENHVIRKVNASGIITTIAGDGTDGYGGDSGAATSAQLNEPWGLAIDITDGSLFIADKVNCRIRRVDFSTGYISTVAGNGTCGYSGEAVAPTTASLNTPYDVTFDDAGAVYYIADGSNRRVRKVTQAGDQITTVAGTGTSGDSGDGGAATSATFGVLMGVAVRGSGSDTVLYITDELRNRVRRVDIGNNTISAFAGTGSIGSSGDGGEAVNAELYRPVDATTDLNGHVFIADQHNHKIRRVVQ